MAARVIAACGGSVRGKTIAVLGLTFKPETDDMRDAPSIPIVSRLVEEGALVKAFDPGGIAAARLLLPAQVIYSPDLMSTVADADALVVITEWNDFRAIAPDRLVQTMRGRVVMDLRNVFDPPAMLAAGLAYVSIGRPH